jgi:hypothetical protein
MAGEAESAELSRALPFVPGCWRVAPALVPDTLLRNPVILSRLGDTLLVALAKDRALAVILRADTLRAAAPPLDGPTVVRTARREACPSVP